MGKSNKIKIAIVGVGNCAASLLQGIDHYSQNSSGKEGHIGLLNHNLGGYRPEDIQVVAAFDIDSRKVEKPLEEAIKAKPNCVYPIKENIAPTKVRVKMGKVLDGVAEHMKNYPSHRTFNIADQEPVDVDEELRQSEAEILLNYLPVGSEQAAEFYAKCCLDSGISLINCMPVFIVSNKKWAKKFSERKIPCVGDDIKSQIGATIIHRTLAKLFADRGVKLERTYQLNTGGNTDFLNMLSRDRLKSKRISKTEAVQSQLDSPMEADNIYIGPSDYIPWQNDNKICFLRMEGTIFGGVPMNLELRLSVQDSPNSAGVSIDAIRCCKIARDRKIGGPLTSISAFAMKHPPEQFSDNEAKGLVKKFIAGEIER
jgi:myo-inositol-1-phosphate synthase